jgi:acyl-CoA synthetase (AMP-forming)/AMP-acid ligase II
MKDLTFLGRRGSLPAIIDGVTNVVLTYSELDDLVQLRKADLGDGPGVAILLCENTVRTVVDYLAALAANFTVMPLDAQTDSAALSLIVESYRPEWILCEFSGGGFAGYSPRGESAALHRTLPDDVVVGDDLAILLSTSGSTGSPRMVRLTTANLNANTESIVASLSIVPGDRAISSMPLHYSYGLSVLNSHLAAGSSVVISGSSVLDPLFWSAISTHCVTTFAAVPYTFAMLNKIQYDPASTPSISKITQAGGKLDIGSTLAWHTLCEKNEVEFFVMYGQTEAAPRMTCLPSDRLKDKLGSVGLPMFGGNLFIDEVDSDTPAGSQGEIIYRGPNVMLGYASAREDLTNEDDMHGILRTGDVGFLDEDGFLFITGRLKRIAKLFGTRVSLDEVEALMATLGVVAAVGGGDRLHIHHQNVGDKDVALARKALSRTLKTPLAAVVMHYEVDFPLMPSGKVDYRTLTDRHSSERVS